MKLNQKTKAILWSILEKYDGISEYIKFCDSLSNIIQDKNESNDLLVVYINLVKIEKCDRNKIDETIGNKIDTLLFSI